MGPATRTGLTTRVSPAEQADPAGALGSHCSYGDYFGAGLDPNGYNVWVTDEFVSLQNEWRTEIAGLPLPP